MIDHPPASLAGRFKILELIGQGAMSTVYRGVDTASDEQVAIKQLRPEVVEESPSVVDRFKHEGHTLRKLNHPSIVRFVAMIEESDQLYLITEYVPGGSLKELLAEKTHLAVRRVVEVAFDLADALASAHELGIIHRDIKPTNVLFAEDGTPRLTDFGIAFGFDSLASNAETPPSHHSTIPPFPRREGRAGTLAYMSPECFRGEDAGPESDIWSLGLVLFEMLTGELPFEENRRGDFVAAQLTRPIPGVSTYRRDIPDKLASLIRRMLVQDRAARISNAHEVSSELKTIFDRTETGKKGDWYLEDGSVQSHASSARGHFTAPFIGREKELAEIERLLLDPAQRIITLLGPGGIGKSRLALETITRLTGMFSNGIYHSSMIPLSGAEQLVPALSRALGFTLQGAQDPMEQFKNYTRDKELLIILDSFEHLLDAAEILAEIAEAGLGVTFLVTSRQRLGIECEAVVEIGGLPVPDAVRLFLACAGFSTSDRSSWESERNSLLQICRMVDGVPLALELASAWTRNMTCSRIVSGIEGSLDFLTSSHPEIPERHRSIRAVFDHTWKLLHDSERKLLGRLSVFRGGFTVEAARKVSGASIEVLSALVAQSLLYQNAEGRYGMHGLLREYVIHEAGSGSRSVAEAEELHAQFYDAFLRRLEENIHNRDTETLRNIDLEIGNLRAGWEWIVSKGSVSDIGAYLDGLASYCLARSLFREGNDISKKAADAIRNRFASDQQGEATLGMALMHRSEFMQLLGSLEQALQLAEEGHRILSRAGAEPEIASAIYTIGSIQVKLGDFKAARASCSDALSILEKLERWSGVANCLDLLGTVAFRAGETDKAKGLLTKAIATYRQANDVSRCASPLNNLAGIDFRAGNLEGARDTLLESLKINREYGDRAGMAGNLNNLGFISTKMGDFHEAATYYRESLDIRRDIGDRRGVALTLHNLGDLHFDKKDFSNARGLFLEAHDLGKEMGDKLLQSGCLISLGDIALEFGDMDEAWRSYGDALVIAREIGAIPMVIEILRGAAQLMAMAGDGEGALKTSLVLLRREDLDIADREVLDNLKISLEQRLSPQTVAAISRAASRRSIEELAREVFSMESPGR